MELILSEFKKTYLDGGYQNPPKIHLDLLTNTETGEVTNYANVMAAYLPDGHYGSKIISITQDGVHSNAILNLYRSNPDNTIETLGSIDFLKPTQLRCALLARLIVENDTRLEFQRLSIGIVGLGAIGQMTIDQLSYYKNLDFVLYARNSKEAKKGLRILQKLNVNGYVVFTYKLLCEQSDYVITCTSASYESDTLTTKHLDSTVTPTKFISFDSGYIIGEDIRSSCPIFTDSIGQLKEFYLGGDEFPHDTTDYSYESYGLHSLLTVPDSKETYSLYFTGMAVFDIIIAKHFNLVETYLLNFEITK